MAEHLYAVVAFCPHCGFAEPAFGRRQRRSPARRSNAVPAMRKLVEVG
jgi:hypothetical protein